MATETDSGMLRTLVGAATVDPRWLPDIARVTTDAILRALPELEADEELRVATYASTESVLRLLADMLALEQPASDGDPPPAAIALARELVRRGVPMDVLLRAYYVGHAAFFQGYVRHVNEEIADPADRARAVELGAAWTFEYVQALSHGLIARYTDERERWVRSALAVRTETVRALLAGERFDQRLASQRLVYELDREHLAFCVWGDDERASDEDFAALELIAQRVAQALGSSGPLVVPLDSNLVAAWIGDHDDLTAAEVEQVREAAGPALVAFGTRSRRTDGFCRSHREAMHTRRVARLAGRRPGSVIRFPDVALTALSSLDLDLARDFVAHELGGLTADDDATRRVAATLRVYLEESGNRRKTAQRLGVHENTVKNRLRTAEGLLGRPAEERIAETLLALRLWRLTRDPDREG